MSTNRKKYGENENFAHFFKIRSSKGEASVERFVMMETKLKEHVYISLPVTKIF